MSAETERPIVVVGAGAAGLATADALRHEGYSGSIVLVGGEQHPPYDRPPLSKQVLSGSWEPGRVSLRSAEQLATAGVECRFGAPAVGVDTTARTLHLDDQTTVDYQELVVATGVRARRLPFGHDLAGVHVLRDLDDALAIKTALQRRSGIRMVVIGAGFLGSEIAAGARELFAEVSLVDPVRQPLIGVLGSGPATMIADLHSAHGVALHLGKGVISFTSEHGRVSAVVLDDGATLDADLVVVAIGSVPATEWLRSSAVPLVDPSAAGGDGVRCDEQGKATEHVWAVGDVAAWWNAAEQRFVRTEHRLTANEHARTVARSIVRRELPKPPVPYFWSDQYDVTVQSFGLPSGTDAIRVIDGSLEQRRFVALYGRAGRVSAVVGAGRPKALRQWRTAVAEGWSFDHAINEAAGAHA